MAIFEIESLSHAIAKAVGYTLIGASIGMYQGCTWEGAKVRNEYNQKIKDCYKDLKGSVNEKQLKRLEELLLGE